MDSPVFALPFISADLSRASEATGVSVREIQRAIESGDLVAHYIGAKASKPVLAATELFAWVQSRPTERGTAA